VLVLGDDDAAGFLEIKLVGTIGNDLNEVLSYSIVLT
jgi:hypothetical protein